MCVCVVCVCGGVCVAVSGRILLSSRNDPDRACTSKVLLLFYLGPGAGAALAAYITDRHHRRSAARRATDAAIIGHHRRHPRPSSSFPPMPPHSKSASWCRPAPERSAAASAQ